MRNSRAARQAEGTFLVEGSRTLRAAFEAKADLEVLYVAAEAEDASAELIGAARRAGVPVVRLSSAQLGRVTASTTPQPLFALARRRPAVLADLASGGLVVVGLEVSDPGNAGSLVRCAGAGAACGVVFSRGSVDVTNPKAVRASAGALFSVPVVEGVDPIEVLGALGARGFFRLGAVPRGGRPYDRVDLTAPIALIFGNESRGLSAEVEASLDGLVTIPTDSRVESLNLATAAAILLFEARRQRRELGDRRPDEGGQAAYPMAGSAG
ncbi:MAG: TrmH family RNA methyltransferase [Acidimicrobiia bacterium]